MGLKRVYKVLTEEISRLETTGSAYVTALIFAGNLIDDELRKKQQREKSAILNSCGCPSPSRFGTKYAETTIPLPENNGEIEIEVERFDDGRIVVTIIP